MERVLESIKFGASVLIIQKMILFVFHARDLLPKCIRMVPMIDTLYVCSIGNIAHSLENINQSLCKMCTLNFA